MVVWSLKASRERGPSSCELPLNERCGDEVGSCEALQKRRAVHAMSVQRRKTDSGRRLLVMDDKTGNAAGGGGRSGRASDGRLERATKRCLKGEGPGDARAEGQERMGIGGVGGVGGIGGRGGGKRATDGRTAGDGDWSGARKAGGYWMGQGPDRDQAGHWDHFASPARQPDNQTTSSAPRALWLPDGPWVTPRQGSSQGQEDRCRHKCRRKPGCKQKRRQAPLEQADSKPYTRLGTLASYSIVPGSR